MAEDPIKNYDSSSSDWEKLSFHQLSSSSDEDETNKDDDEWLIIKNKKPKDHMESGSDDDDDDDGNMYSFYGGEAEQGTDRTVFMTELLSTILPELASNDKFSLDYIELHVFPHLPTKTLLRLRHASPRWSRWISNPFFVHSHSLTSRSLSGFFFHSPSGHPSFSPLESDADDEPTNSSFSLPPLPEPVIIKSSNHGLLCLLGRRTRTYYICNPATSQWSALPPHAIDHGHDPAVAIVMQEPLTYNFDDDYFLVCAFEICDGVYGSETFSSDKWGWGASKEIVAAERIVAGSGVAVAGAAYWRTTMQTVAAYEPAADAWRELVFPAARGSWEIGELGGKFCVVNVGVGAVAIWVWESQRRWVKVGEIGFGAAAAALDDLVVAVRGQGMREVAVWDGGRRTVRVRDVERGTERELAEKEKPGYCADFVPYVSSLVHVKSGPQKQDSLSNKDLDHKKKGVKLSQG